MTKTKSQFHQIQRQKVEIEQLKREKAELEAEVQYAQDRISSWKSFAKGVKDMLSHEDAEGGKK